MLDAPRTGRLAWTDSGVLLVDLDGNAWRGTDPAAGRWRPAGTVHASPAALDTGPDGELLVALHDGTIMHSTDAGRTWRVRSRP